MDAQTTSGAALKIGVAGLGNVGASVVRLLQDNAQMLAARAGRPVVVTAVSARDAARDRGFKRDGITFHADARDLVKDPNVDVVVEVIGGAQGMAWDVVSGALALDKPVVTANKAMLALRGKEVLAALTASKAPLAFEAAVAGGIPAIKTLREGLAANNIRAVYGILNGTCNYIMSEMTETGRAFADVLADAQKLGYAEADPTFDVDGHDASHKLAILAALAFGGVPNVDAIKVSGIRAVSALDIGFARELGYRIRLLGIARKRDSGIEQTVEACLVPMNSPLASVEGPLNAVYVDGDFCGKILLTGAGAGGDATASAVVADIIDFARGHHLPLLGRPVDAGETVAVAPIGKRMGHFYLRLQVIDQPGVIADVSAILRDCAVSLETVLQRGRDPGQEVSVILTLHETEQARVDEAVQKIAALKSVKEAPHLMRIEVLS